MNWIFAAALSALLVELAVRLPFVGAVRGVVATGRKAVRVLSARGVSDHWKERALGAYARASFRSTAVLALLLAVLLAVAGVLVWTVDRLALIGGEAGFQAFMLDWRGLGATLVFACAYLYARRSVRHGRL